MLDRFGSHLWVCLFLFLVLNLCSKPDDNFHLIFPNLSIFAVTLAVFTFNYISTDGSANYFIGAVLVMMYFIILSAFYFVPEVL